MFTATKKQQHYLKQLAALQFPGSIDNLSTRLPIYALEQQLPKDDTVKLDDAVIEGQDFACRFAPNNMMKGYDSIAVSSI